AGPAEASATIVHRALRELGMEVETISIRRPRSDELLTEEDRIEAARTFAVLPPRPLALIAAHLTTLTRHPWRYIRTLAIAIGGAAPGVRSRLWAGFYFAEAALVRRHCRRLGVHHLHATQFADAAADVAMLAARLEPGWTWSLTVHGPGEFYEARRYRLAEKVCRAAFTTAVSEFTRSQLLALAGTERAAAIHVVRMGADLERFRPTERAERLPAETRVLCVARLVAHKGQAVLLRALARLRDDGLPLRTTIAGDGPERDPLRRLVDELDLQGLVEFSGAVSQEALPGLYAEADVFCLPTLAEAVGVVNMEAMATGLPVVSSRLMGVPELVEDGGNGLLVTPGRDGELAVALRRLAEDPDLRQRLGREGRRKVEAEFDPAREAARLSVLLEALI
ncbi:MAG: glycosyltransferase family 4 protein, partial [Gaiellaceae bacterium]